MKLLILGGSGRTGARVSELARARGHLVSVLNRSIPSGAPESGVRTFLGDATDPDVLAPLLPQHDCLVSCLGQRGPGDIGVLTRFAEAMVAAVRSAGPLPLIVLSQGLLFPTRNPLMVLLRGALARHVRDSIAMEAVLRSSGLDACIVRPPRLLDGGSRRGYRIAVDARPGGPGSMQRADLAKFLIDEAERPDHRGKIVGITSG